MADPISWLMIEPGWQVVDASGEELGRVEAVTGDSGADIFDGLAVSSGMFSRPKYVPAEQVGTITDGQVQLKLAQAAVAALGEYEVPAASEEIEPEKAPMLERGLADVERVNPREHSPGLVRRALDWLGLGGKR
jgi:hypothetical protein